MFSDLVSQKDLASIPQNKQQMDRDFPIVSLPEYLYGKPSMLIYGPNQNYALNVPLLLRD